MPLVCLHAVNTPIRDITPLVKTSLKELKLDGCVNLKDVSALAQCRELELLTLPTGCAGIENLRGLPRLKRIGCSSHILLWESVPTPAEFWKDFDAGKYPQFEFRNVGANGEIWTGEGTATHRHFPALENVPRADWPHENISSTSFRLSYGKFKFFNGGDIPGIPGKGRPAWHDMETPVAKAVGPVDAAILDHHGYLDTHNEFFVATLRPRVWTISVWDAGHPTPGVWERLQSTQLYPGPREVFATDVHPTVRQTIPGIDKLASDHGHIVLRVSPGGGEYRVVIVDDSSESLQVTKVFGPYQSR
jgi:hypothetical protein